MKKIAMYFKFAIIYMLVIICVDIFVICKKMSVIGMAGFL